MKSSSVRIRFCVTALDSSNPGRFIFTEKTIHDEEVSNVDIAESMAELKVRLIGVLGSNHFSYGTFTFCLAEQTRGAVRSEA